MERIHCNVLFLENDRSVVRCGRQFTICVTGNILANADSLIEVTINAEQDVFIGDNSTVLEDIYSEQSVYIGKNVTLGISDIRAKHHIYLDDFTELVCGAILADGNVYLGDNCIVGRIIADGEVHLGDNCITDGIIAGGNVYLGYNCTTGEIRASSQKHN